jgi:hypothetical protein
MNDIKLHQRSLQQRNLISLARVEEQKPNPAKCIMD